MSKKILGALLFIISIGLLAQGAIKAEKQKRLVQKDKTSGWTVARICFSPGAPAFPERKNVYGVNFGIPASYNYDYLQKIYGLDIGFIVDESKVDGFQMAITNFSKGSEGIQMSLANLVEKFTGVQLGVGNLARNSEALQLGIINFARGKSNCVQFGLLNFNNRGFLPVFPIINFTL